MIFEWKGEDLCVDRLKWPDYDTASIRDIIIQYCIDDYGTIILVLWYWWPYWLWWYWLYLALTVLFAGILWLLLLFDGLGIPTDVWPPCSPVVPLLLIGCPSMTDHSLYYIDHSHSCYCCVGDIRGIDCYYLFVDIVTLLRYSGPSDAITNAMGHSDDIGRLFIVDHSIRLLIVLLLLMGIDTIHLFSIPLCHSWWFHCLLLIIGIDVVFIYLLLLFILRWYWENLTFDCCSFGLQHWIPMYSIVLKVTFCYSYYPFQWYLTLYLFIEYDPFSNLLLLIVIDLIYSPIHSCWFCSVCDWCCYWYLQCWWRLLIVGYLLF